MDGISALCRKQSVPLIVDASQSAGTVPVSLRRWQAAYIAMPGHKGLYGPQGTGLLLCGEVPEPLRYGGTGSISASQEMPAFLPDRLEAGTQNVPGIAGLGAGLRYLQRQQPGSVLRQQQKLIRIAENGLQELGAKVFSGSAQAGVLSFLLPGLEPEEACEAYASAGVALRAGLHCAPLAHKTVGTFSTGTLRLSVSSFTKSEDIKRFLDLSRKLLRKKTKTE